MVYDGCDLVVVGEGLVGDFMVDVVGGINKCDFYGVRFVVGGRLVYVFEIV